jgi:integrase/recombinase XerD
MSRKSVAASEAGAAPSVAAAEPGASIMEQQICRFLEYLQAERGFSQNTVAAYQNDLLQLLHYVRQPPGSGTPGEPGLNGRPAAVDSWELTYEQIRAFTTSLEHREYASSSRARKLAAIKSFFHYLVEAGLVHNDPTRRVNAPRVQKSHPHTITVEEVDRLLAQPATIDTPEALRDTAMLSLLYASGMRVTELVSLDLGDLNLDAALVRCSGRRAKERVIPIGYRAVPALQRYLDEGRPALDRGGDEQALFLNHRGSRLTRQGFWLIIRSHARQAGITSPITPHTLRHSFAAHKVEAGTDLREVQELLGHANISTTQVYAQLVGERSRQPLSAEP